MTARKQVITELLTQYPTAATKTLATIAYRDHKALFTTPEAARSAVREARGAMGKKARSKATHYRKPQKSGNPFKEIPQGISKPWNAFKIEGPTRTLILSDIHIPYHDRTALLAALEYGALHEATHVLLNGDIIDCYALSRWEKNPEERNFKREVEMTREFLKTLREAFPKARIIFKLGNHEERYESYMFVKAPELLGLADFALEKILHFEQYGVECVRDKRPIRLGRLNVLHGHEYKFNISNPVNPARGFFLRAKTHVLGGHLHQVSQHSEKNLDGSVISAWSTGCLCGLNPDYSPLNAWAHGFAFVTTDKQGVFEVNNLRIIEGKVY